MLKMNAVGHWTDICYAIRKTFISLSCMITSINYNFNCWGRHAFLYVVCYITRRGNVYNLFRIYYFFGLSINFRGYVFYLSCYVFITFKFTQKYKNMKSLLSTYSWNVTWLRHGIINFPVYFYLIKQEIIERLIYICFVIG